MNRFFLISLITLLATSCTDSHSSSEAIVPEALNPPEYASISLNSKVRGSSMIHELYEEALENNPELKKLDLRIIDLQEMTSDSLAEINQYIKNNEAFFQEASQLWIPHLADSTLRENEKSQLERLQQKHLARIKGLTVQIERLKNKNVEISDHYWQLKLKTVEDMMSQYQLSSLPESQSVISLIKEQNLILREINSLQEN